MKIVFYNIYKELNKNNFMFEHANALIGDDLLLPLIRLSEKCRSEGVDIGTSDKISISDADAIFFMDMPDKKDKFFNEAKLSGKPMYLIIFESKMIRPENFDRVNHYLFKKIFTWSDELLSGNSEKYIKLNFSCENPKEGIIKKFKGKTLCCMISGNKKSTYPGELYSERLRAVEWFKINSPVDFHLYGIGWDRYTHSNKYINYLLLKLHFLFGFLYKKSPLYRGVVDRKKPILEQYKFSICYENAKEIPGYITEKIFDSFFSGCIPVYLGANNISSYIPDDCFIDKRKFNTYSELYQFLENMTEKEYFDYLERIENYLASDRFYMFSCEYFSKTITNEILQCQSSY